MTKDLQQIIQEISLLEHREIVTGYTGRVIHSEKMTCAFREVEEGAVMPQHTHPREQVTQVLAGKFELTVEGTSTLYEPGMVGIIPSCSRHGGIAITRCKLLDAFSPVREDYR